ncbi:MAG: DUF998 domain-containing protein, partial [Ktedonobacterales bacterium]
TSRSTSAQPELNGATLSKGTLALISLSLVGGLLFTGAYILEGATRPGYSGWQQAISALSLGPDGWMQRVNFVVFGVLVLGATIGWRRALRPGLGATWFPILQALVGVGLIMDGIFSQDAVPGYPVGTVVKTATLHGQIHNIFAYASVLGLIATCFILARRFATEPRWRGWATFSVIAGVLTIVFITLFGAQGAHEGLAGLCERLATGAHSVWSIAIFVQLLLDRRA